LFLCEEIQWKSSLSTSIGIENNSFRSFWVLRKTTPNRENGRFRWFLRQEGQEKEDQEVPEGQHGGPGLQARGECPPWTAGRHEGCDG